MAVTTRWLKWNGVYFHAGLCNRKFADINSDPGIQQRLIVLGFDCGKPDGTATDARNNETKKAIQKFQAYFKMPPEKIQYACELQIEAREYKVKISIDDVLVRTVENAVENYRLPNKLNKATHKIKVETENSPTLVPQVPVVKVALTSAATGATFFRANSAAERNFSVPDNPNRPEYDEFPDTLDNEMKQKLKDLTGGDPKVTKFPVPAHAVQKINVSRNHRADMEMGVTINEKSDIAVQVESVPEEFHSFTQIAWHKIKITGCEKVKSLLFQIYRNFDPKTDADRIPSNKLVYQEVLRLDDLKALPEQPDQHKNVANQTADAAFLLEYSVGYGNGAFTPIGKGNVSWHRVHSPFKIKVWVATDEKAFDNLERDAIRHSLHAEPPVMPSYLFRPDPPAANPPLLVPILDSPVKSTDEVEPKSDLTPDARSLVHDELNKSRDRQGEETENGSPVDLKQEKLTAEDLAKLSRNPVAPPKQILSNWIEIRKIKTQLLLPAKYWTEKNKVGINLIGKPCREHDRFFHEKNQIRLESFAREFQRHPLEIYLDLRTRALKDANFHFPELLETIENIERHINLIKQRVCCGEYQWLPEDKKTEIREVMDNMVAEIRQLRAASPPNRINKSAWVNDVSNGFPYIDTEKFISKFALVFDWIISKTKYEPERDFNLRNVGREVFGSSGELVTRRRNHRIGLEMKGGGVEIYQQTLKAWYDNVGNNFGENNHHNIVRSLQEREVIVLPSYNPLNTTFFTRVRQIPMFVVALMDLPYVMADKTYMSPRAFFDHDNFHIVGTGNIQQWGTMKPRVDELEQKLGGRDEVFIFWDKNAQILESSVNAIPDKNLRDTVDILLFALLHEPIEGSSDKNNPALLEEDSIVSRFRGLAKANSKFQNDIFMNEMHEKLTDGFFGAIFPNSIINNLNNAKQFIEGMAKSFYLP